MSELTKEVRTLVIEVIKQKIAARAHELYEERGGARGAELDDWLRAEDEILGQSISKPLFRS